MASPEGGLFVDLVSLPQSMWLSCPGPMPSSPSKLSALPGVPCHLYVKFKVGRTKENIQEFPVGPVFLGTSHWSEEDSTEPLAWWLCLKSTAISDSNFSSTGSRLLL